MSASTLLRRTIQSSLRQPAFRPSQLSKLRQFHTTSPKMTVHNIETYVPVPYAPTPSITKLPILLSVSLCSLPVSLTCRNDCLRHELEGARYLPHPLTSDARDSWCNPTSYQSCRHTVIPRNKAAELVANNVSFIALTPGSRPSRTTRLSCSTALPPGAVPARLLPPSWPSEYIFYAAFLARPGRSRLESTELHGHLRSNSY